MQNTKMTKRPACLWGSLKAGKQYGMRFETQHQAMDEAIDWKPQAAPVVSGKDAQGKNLGAAELFA
jgi:hypothetical protein